MKKEEKRKAAELRKDGYSLKEISQKLGISKSTASIWSRDIKLSMSARSRLISKIKLGRYVSAENRKAETRRREEKYLDEARVEVEGGSMADKIACAMIFWCEGTKNPSNGMTFTNSDPKLVKKFLYLLRKSFLIDEKKFHPCIHLHGYHSSKKQLDFWSKVTDIDKSQFIKPYLKPNTGKRIHENYEGCISIKYHSNDLARRLIAFAKAYLETGV